MGHWPDLKYFINFGESEDAIEQKRSWLQSQKGKLFRLNEVVSRYCRMDCSILCLSVMLYTMQATILQHLLQELYQMKKVDKHGKANLILPFRAGIITGGAHA